MQLHQIGVREFRIWPTDLDIFKHMNNGVYLTLMDLARFDVLKRTGAWKAARLANIYPIVVGETITFRKSLTLGQKFTIETGVIGWDEVAFFVQQRFVVDGEIYADAVVRLRFLKNPKGTPTPDQVLELIGGWQGEKPNLPAWVLAWDKSVALPKGRDAAPSTWNGRQVV